MSFVSIGFPPATGPTPPPPGGGDPIETTFPSSAVYTVGAGKDYETLHDGLVHISTDLIGSQGSVTFMLDSGVQTLCPTGYVGVPNPSMGGTVMYPLDGKNIFVASATGDGSICSIEVADNLVDSSIVFMLAGGTLAFMEIGYKNLSTANGVADFYGFNSSVILGDTFETNGLTLMYNSNLDARTAIKPLTGGTGQLMIMLQGTSTFNGQGTVLTSGAMVGFGPGSRAFLDDITVTDTAGMYFSMSEGSQVHFKNSPFTAGSNHGTSLEASKVNVVLPFNTMLTVDNLAMTIA